MSFGKRIFDRKHNKTVVRRSLNAMSANVIQVGIFAFYPYMFSYFARETPYLGAVYMILLCRDATRRDSIVMFETEKVKNNSTTLRSFDKIDQAK